METQDTEKPSQDFMDTMNQFSLFLTEMTTTLQVLLRPLVNDLLTLFEIVQRDKLRGWLEDNHFPPELAQWISEWCPRFILTRVDFGNEQETIHAND